MRYFVAFLLAWSVMAIAGHASPPVVGAAGADAAADAVDVATADAVDAATTAVTSAATTAAADTTEIGATTSAAADTTEAGATTSAAVDTTEAGASTADPALKAADRVEDGQPLDLDSPAYRELLRELVAEHGFSPAQLREWFEGVTIQRRVLELMDAQWEAQPYHRYAAPLLSWWNVGNGRVLLARHAELLDRVEAEFGVEREILMAIWGIESNYGGNRGGFRIFRTMNTIFAAYPRRSEFYRQQLVDFLLICRELELDPREVPGSYGGAFGQAQFIPSSYRAYAVDFDGSGRRDILHSVPDVLASIANYLRHFGWQYGEPWYAELGEQLQDPRLQEATGAGRRGVLPRAVIEAAQGVKLPTSPGDKPLRIVGLQQADGSHRYLAAYPNFQAITHWNNSYRYAMVVIELAEKLAAPPAPPARP